MEGGSRVEEEKGGRTESQRRKEVRKEEEKEEEEEEENNKPSFKKNEILIPPPLPTSRVEPAEIVPMQTVGTPTPPLPSIFGSASAELDGEGSRVMEPPALSSVCSTVPSRPLSPPTLASPINKGPVLNHLVTPPHTHSSHQNTSHVKQAPPTVGHTTSGADLPCNSDHSPPATPPSRTNHTDPPSSQVPPSSLPVHTVTPSALPTHTLTPRGGSHLHTSAPSQNHNVTQHTVTPSHHSTQQTVTSSQHSTQHTVTPPHQGTEHKVTPSPHHQGIQHAVTTPKAKSWAAIVGHSGCGQTSQAIPTAGYGNSVCVKVEGGEVEEGGVRGEGRKGAAKTREESAAGLQKPCSAHLRSLGGKRENRL